MSDIVKYGLNRPSYIVGGFSTRILWSTKNTAKMLTGEFFVSPATAEK